MKKVLIIFLLTIFVGTVGLACAKPAPAPAPAPTPAPTPAPAPAPEVFTLRITGPLNATHPMTIGLLEWIQEVEKATDGQVKLIFATGSELGIKASDHPLAIRDGIVDMATGLGIYSAGLEDFLNFDVLPYLMWTKDDYRAAFKLIKPYFDTVMAEKFNAKILMHHVFPPQNLFLSETIDSLEDLKGRKLRAYGKALPAMYEKLGITPLTIPYLEWPIAMERGMVQGGITSTDGFADISGWEGAKYVYLDMGIFRPSEFLMVNLDSWNKLPADVQDTIVQVSKDFDDNYFWPKMDTEVHEQYLQILIDNGMTAYEFKDEWKVEIAGLMAYFWDEWAEKNADKGAKEWLQQVRAQLGR